MSVIKFDEKLSGMNVAFVQPGNLMVPQIESASEAYFGHFEEAYKWLKEQT